MRAKKGAADGWTNRCGKNKKTNAKRKLVGKKKAGEKKKKTKGLRKPKLVWAYLTS